MYKTINTTCQKQNYKMRHFSIFIFAGIFSLSACGPRVSTSILKSFPTLDYREEVRIYALHETAPPSALLLGQVRVGDTGFSTNCGFEIVSEKAKMEARKVGGNAIKITEHKHPGFESTCHRITARILKVDNFDEVNNEKVVDSTLVHADYALLHVYRFGGAGFLVSYDLHLGDTVIHRVSNKSKKTIKIRKEGPNVLWARTEAREEMPINIKMGEEYYVRCGIGMGAFVGRPQIQLVEKQSGSAEYQSIVQKKSDKDSIVMKDGRVIECIITGEDEEQLFITILSKGVDVDTYILKDEVDTISRRDHY